MNENSFETNNAVEPGSLKSYFSRLGLACLLLVGVNFVMQNLLNDLLAKTAFAEHWSYLWFLSLVPLYCVALPIFWLVLPKTPDADRSRRPYGKGRFVIVCIISMTAMMLFNYVGFYVTRLINVISGGALGNSDALNTIVNASPAWATLLFACVIGPIMEEFVFRKLLIDRIKPYGEFQACLFSGLIFGMFHGNFLQFFYAAALGCIFAFVYVKTNNLLHTIALHIGLNVLGSVVMPSILSGKNLAVIEKLAENPEAATTNDLLTLLLVLGALMVGGGLLVAGVVLFFVRLRKIKFDPPAYTVNGGIARLIYSAPATIAAMAAMAGMFVLALL